MAAKRKRRIFISFNHRDRMRARGFRLLRFNKNTKVDFIDRNFIDPINSKDETYIRRRIREEISKTDAIVVLVGRETKDSDWVKWEVEEADKQGKGIVGIKLKNHDDCDVPWLREEYKARIVPWDHRKFNEEIDAAIRVRSRVKESPPQAPGC